MCNNNYHCIGHYILPNYYKHVTIILYKIIRDIYKQTIPSPPSSPKCLYKNHLSNNIFQL